jgi:Beta-1,3-glucanase
MLLWYRSLLPDGDDWLEIQGYESDSGAAMCCELTGLTPDTTYEFALVRGGATVQLTTPSSRVPASPTPSSPFPTSDLLVEGILLHVEVGTMTPSTVSLWWQVPPTAKGYAMYRAYGDFYGVSKAYSTLSTPPPDPEAIGEVGHSAFFPTRPAPMPPPTPDDGIEPFRQQTYLACSLQPDGVYSFRLDYVDEAGMTFTGCPITVHMPAYDGPENKEDCKVAGRDTMPIRLVNRSGLPDDAVWLFVAGIDESKYAKSHRVVWVKGIGERVGYRGRHSLGWVDSRPTDRPSALTWSEVHNLLFEEDLALEGAFDMTDRVKGILMETSVDKDGVAAPSPPAAVGSTSWVYHHRDWKVRTRDVVHAATTATDASSVTWVTYKQVVDKTPPQTFDTSDLQFVMLLARGEDLLDLSEADDRVLDMELPSDVGWLAVDADDRCLFAYVEADGTSVLTADIDPEERFYDDAECRRPKVKHVHASFTVAEAKSRSVYDPNSKHAGCLAAPQLSSCRMYISYGRELYLARGTGGLGAGTTTLVNPSIRNPTDPNVDLVYDFLEYTFARNPDGSSITFINTTQVDNFGLSLILELDRAKDDPIRDPASFFHLFPPTEEHAATSYARDYFPPLLRNVAGFNASRDELFAAYRREMAGTIFESEAAYPKCTISPTTGDPVLVPPIRGDMPMSAIMKRSYDEQDLILVNPGVCTNFEEGGVASDYFEGVVDEFYQKYALNPFVYGLPNNRSPTGSVNGATGVLTYDGWTFQKKPTTMDIIGAGTLLQGCSDLMAAFQRGIALTPERNRDPSAFYPEGVPCNMYSKFLHGHAIDGNAYGFSYDDNCDFSSTLAGRNCRQVTVTLLP